MSEASKPTPGPWTVEKISKGQYVISGAEGELIESFYEVFGEQRLQANMRLITEAGTVHHETGLTPRQLVEQRDALAEALLQTTDVYEAMRSKLAEMYPQDGWSAETMTIDQARAALAMVKGAKP